VPQPFWTAPEVLTTGRTSPEADVYAFGIMFWELLTLRVGGFHPAPPHLIAVRVDVHAQRPFSHKQFASPVHLVQAIMKVCRALQRCAEAQRGLMVPPRASARPFPRGLRCGCVRCVHSAPADPANALTRHGTGDLLVLGPEPGQSAKFC
jgi:hypothetical protein